MKKYFEVPTQVEWFDKDNEYWIGGIAYKNEIICGCCGSVIKLEEIEDDKVMPLEWYNISDAIVGN